MISALDSFSLRPYLIRAMHEWCVDQGLTPYLAVWVDESVQVPREFVKNGEIVLNMSFDATKALQLGNEYIEFKARFAGVARDIVIPIGNVAAIYARENSQGLVFPPPAEGEAPPPSGGASASRAAEGEPAMRLVPHSDEPAPAPAPASDGMSPEDDPPKPPAGAPRPSLKRIK